MLDHAFFDRRLNREGVSRACSFKGRRALQSSRDLIARNCIGRSVKDPNAEKSTRRDKPWWYAASNARTSQADHLALNMAIAPHGWRSARTKRIMSLSLLARIGRKGWPEQRDAIFDSMSRHRWLARRTGWINSHLIRPRMDRTSVRSIPWKEAPRIPAPDRDSRSTARPFTPPLRARASVTSPSPRASLAETDRHRLIGSIRRECIDRVYWASAITTDSDEVCAYYNG